MALSSPPEATEAFVTAAPEDVDLLRRLVAIESTSDNEAAAVAELCRQMAARGFRAEVDAAGNAVGTIGRGPRRVVLLGHIDTVPGRIPVRIEGGVLHGRGAVDAKGPLCAFVAAAAAAATRANATITVVGAVGEERIGSPGATAVAAWPAPDYCVIGEPSGWDAVCLGYRGTLSLIYRLRQAARHTAGPGESVAERAVAFWNVVVAEVAARNAVSGAGVPGCGVQTPRSTDEVPPGLRTRTPTVGGPGSRSNEGTGAFGTLTPALRGMGTTSDGLSDEATLSIGLRLPPGVRGGELLERLRSLAGEAELTVEGMQEGYREEKRSPLVPPFLRSIRATGGTPRFTLKLGTSDMTVVGPAWRCPIVAYGPGDAALDHTPEERIELADYGRAIRVLTDVLVSL